MLAAFVLMAALSEKMEGEIARVEKAASQSRMFRRLSAETEGVARSAGELAPRVWVRYEPPPEGRLVFDDDRLDGFSARELQVELARELARAAIQLPAPIYEAELAAAQKSVVVAVELAYADKAYGKKLAAQVKTGTGRTGALCALILEGPERFYSQAGRHLDLPPGTVKLTELEDFLALHAPKLADLTVDGEFVKIGGRPYPAYLVRAAKALLPLGGAPRARADIGEREREEAGLRRRLKLWLYETNRS